MEITSLAQEYYEVLAQQQFVEEHLDYTILDRQKPSLDQLAKIGNSGVTVFDLHRKEHVFTSYNFSDLFGYDLYEIEHAGNEYFNSRVHPDDHLEMMRNGIELLRFSYTVPIEERTHYKMINEYRILNSRSQYIRVIEQHQTLELDKYGNIWLALGVIDISPDQNDFQGVKAQLLNFKTGQMIPMSSLHIKQNHNESAELTKREKEILGLIKDGLLSKEISDRLFISVHTVNTHRQRILEKLNAGNSMEAVAFASRLGLLGK